MHHVTLGRHVDESTGVVVRVQGQGIADDLHLKVVQRHIQYRAGAMIVPGEVHFSIERDSGGALALQLGLRCVDREGEYLGAVAALHPLVEFHLALGDLAHKVVLEGLFDGPVKGAIGNQPFTCACIFGCL